MPFGIIAALLWATSNVVSKLGVESYIRDPFINTLIANIVGFIIAVPIIINSISIGYTNIIILSVLAGGIYHAALFLFFRAIDEQEIVQTSSWLRLAPIWTFVLATIFLDESYSTDQQLGIAVIILGIGLASRLLSRTRSLNMALFRAISSSILFGTAFVVSKVALKEIEPAFHFAAMQLGGAVFLVWVYFVRFIRKIPLEIPKKSKTFVIPIFARILNYGGLFAAVIALRNGPAGAVHLLIAGQIVILMGFSFLLHQIDWKQSHYFTTPKFIEWVGGFMIMAGEALLHTN